MAQTRNGRAKSVAQTSEQSLADLIEKNKQRRAGDENGGNFRGRLNKTVSYLRWKAACNTLSDAIGYIASELERERLYALYRRIFPKEWKASGASFQRTGYNECHTEREIEFIELVSEHYFPLCTWLDWSDFRFDHIPIEPVNYDFCCDEYEWQHFRPCLQFAITAFLWRDTDNSDENWTEMLASFNVGMKICRKSNAQRRLFGSRCRTRRSENSAFSAFNRVYFSRFRQSVH